MPSNSPEHQLVRDLKHTSLITRLNLAAGPPPDGSKTPLEYLDNVSWQDRPIMHRYLVDQMRPLRPDAQGQEAARVLLGLSKFNQDDVCHLQALQLAFNLFSAGASAQ